jgi:hypothetical protein
MASDWPRVLIIQACSMIFIVVVAVAIATSRILAHDSDSHETFCAQMQISEDNIKKDPDGGEVAAAAVRDEMVRRGCC